MQSCFTSRAELLKKGREGRSLTSRPFAIFRAFFSLITSQFLLNILSLSGNSCNRAQSGEHANQAHMYCQPRPWHSHAGAI